MQLYEGAGKETSSKLRSSSKQPQRHPCPLADSSARIAECHNPAVNSNTSIVSQLPVCAVWLGLSFSMWFPKSATGPSGNWPNGLRNVAMVIRAWQSFLAKCPNSLFNYLAQPFKMGKEWEMLCFPFNGNTATPLSFLCCISVKCHSVATRIFQHLDKMQGPAVKQHITMSHSCQLPRHCYQRLFFLFYISRENAFSSNKTTIVHKQKWLTVQLHLPASFYITWENITKQKPPANCCGSVAVRAQGRPPRPHWTPQGNSSGYEAQYSRSALVKSYCQERPSSLRNTTAQNITASISVSSER